MSDERYNNTGRWRSNWQKIRDPQQKADALVSDESSAKVIMETYPELCMGRL